MTIDEAIKILKYHRDAVGEVAGSEFANALQLGIEALKTIKKWRNDHRDLGFLLLPGETE